MSNFLMQSSHTSTCVRIVWHILVLQTTVRSSPHLQNRRWNIERRLYASLMSFEPLQLLWLSMMVSEYLLITEYKTVRQIRHTARCGKLVVLTIPYYLRCIQPTKGADKVICRQATWCTIWWIQVCLQILPLTWLSSSSFLAWLSVRNADRKSDACISDHLQNCRAISLNANCDAPDLAFVD